MTKMVKTCMYSFNMCDDDADENKLEISGKREGCYAFIQMPYSTRCIGTGGANLLETT